MILFYTPKQLFYYICQDDFVSAHETTVIPKENVPTDEPKKRRKPERPPRIKDCAPTDSNKGIIFMCMNILFFLNINFYTFISISLSIYPSIYQTINLSIYLSIYLFIYISMNLSIYLSINLSMNLSIYLSINISIYQ